MWEWLDEEYYDLRERDDCCDLDLEEMFEYLLDEQQLREDHPVEVA